MKTIKQWAEYLPQEIRVKFLNNFEDSSYCEGRTITSLLDSINNAFYWEETKEGHDYWLEIARKARNGEFNNLPIITMEKNLDQIIAEAESIIANAKEMKLQQEKSKKKLRPNIGDTYWYLLGTGEVNNYSWGNDDTDINIWNYGNGFFTQEEAEKEQAKRQAIQRVKDYLIANDLLCTEEEENDKEFEKYSVSYDIIENKIFLCSSGWKKNYSPFGILKKESKEFLKDCKEDLKIILNVK